jgi:hypothetical protein
MSRAYLEQIGIVERLLGYFNQAHKDAVGRMGRGEYARIVAQVVENLNLSRYDASLVRDVYGPATRQQYRYQRRRRNNDPLDDVPPPVNPIPIPEVIEETTYSVTIRIRIDDPLGEVRDVIYVRQFGEVPSQEELEDAAAEDLELGIDTDSPEGQVVQRDRSSIVDVEQIEIWRNEPRNRF